MLTFIHFSLPFFLVPREEQQPVSQLQEIKRKWMSLNDCNKKAIFIETTRHEMRSWSEPKNKANRLAALVSWNEKEGALSPKYYVCWFLWQSRASLRSATHHNLLQVKSRFSFVVFLETTVIIHSLRSSVECWLIMHTEMIVSMTTKCRDGTVIW